jgi:hypothetical protein
VGQIQQNIDISAKTETGFSEINGAVVDANLGGEEGGGENKRKGILLK